ncbi:[protein-PII] uridylyltransferase [Kineosphaera limosa]|uniref:Bifunctional uridylyltransferase/uridylyl-removing enzyme n=1 Tax=Kineosphaera limosa NBRC 100340 TaxID=1184609 RepID=K6WR45_9MICO|nr:[protein-PII] uridylyltransferase [Kineosphaera limosa]NYD99441.1 [protein-PII] uridylyltransferase [Kineosphaera limosa]GAB94577.1 PII uridylyltransferase [Kineosphaera limosa NBRC 100340]
MKAPDSAPARLVVGLPGGPGDLRKMRTDAASLRAFTELGAGARRRDAIASVTGSWLQRAWLGAQTPRDGVALAAVGSLARADSGPASDLDLVLLHDGRRSAAELAQIAEQHWYPLWDSGVRLDHSVRTLAECRAVAGADLVAAVGLLDLRMIAGDADLVAGVRSSVAYDWRANARKRLPELLEAVRERHERYGELAHLIEPDLKEARGGLRDLTIIRALAAAWLADRPRGQVDEAYQRLLDARDALHLVTGRGRERLVQQEHDAVAALLGYRDADLMLKDVADAGRAIAHALDSTTRRAGQSQRARALRIGPRKPALTPLGHGLSSHDGEVVLGPRTDPGADPLLILRAARAAASAQLPIGPTTLENLVENVPHLPKPWPPNARDLFGELLASGEGLVGVWESLTLAGVIEQWIPAWSTIRSLPQHNPVHRHTVDRHSLEAVVHARRLLADVRRPDVLLLACLLHDLGKAFGAEDHAAIGAEPAEQAVLALGYEPQQAKLVALLVRHHLTLVDLATRRDPDDPRTPELLCAAVDNDLDTLELLRALTEADARAAGPAAWSSWRSRLVDDLVTAARARLAPGAPALDSAESSVQIPGHVRVAAQRLGVQVRVEDHGDGQLVEVVAPDRVGLFADTAGVLAAHGLSVRRARLSTDDGIAIDHWHVESPSGARADREALERAMLRLRSGDRRGLAPLSRRPVPVPDAPVTRALLVPDAAADATVLELRATDRPGLLHDVGRCLAQLTVSVRSAHVATYCGQAVDTVYLTEPDGSQLAPARVAQVIRSLIDAATTP